MQQHVRATAIIKGAVNTEIARLRRAGDAALKKGTPAVAQVYYEMATDYEATLRQLDNQDIIVTERNASVHIGSSTEPSGQPGTLKNK